MLATEKAAREKWCPLVRIDGSNRSKTGASGKPDHAAELYHCIAGRCMFWRELHATHLKTTGEKTTEIPGYCGMAGHPEANVGW